MVENLVGELCATYSVEHHAVYRRASHIRHLDEHYRYYVSLSTQ